MKWTWMASGVLAAAVMGLAAPAQAGVRVGIVLVGHDDYGYRDTNRIGFDRGYQDGLHHGAKDRHHETSYNFWHDKRYRCGDAGYRSRYGPRYEYVAGYRRGYEQGYRNAYARTRYDDRHDRDRYGDRYRDDRDRYRYDDRYDRRDRDGDDDVIYEDPYRR